MTHLQTNAVTKNWYETFSERSQFVLKVSQNKEIFLNGPKTIGPSYTALKQLRDIHEQSQNKAFLECSQNDHYMIMFINDLTMNVLTFLHL